MSVEVAQLNLIRQIDPRTDVSSSDRRTYGIFDGGSLVSYKTAVVDGGLSNNQLTFEVNPPSTKTFINRRPLINVIFDITFTGTSAGPGIPLLQCAGLNGAAGVDVGNQFYDAPRYLPLAQAMSNLQITLSNGSISSSLNQYIRVLPTYSSSVHANDTTFSMTPTMLDQSQSYADLNGFARDPLRGYGDNPQLTPRGGFVGCEVLRNDSTGTPADVAVVRLNVIEHLYLAPMLFEDGAQDTGLIGIDTMTVTVSLNGRAPGPLGGLASALWSHSPLGSVITSAVANVVNASMRVSFIKPDPTQFISDTNLYPLYHFQDYPFSTNLTFAPGDALTVQNNAIQFNSIPSRVYIFASRRDQDCNISTTDTFFGIENVKISFENQDSLLALASPQDLYQIAVKNGTNLSWNQWSKHYGSVLALDFGSDIPLDTVRAVGMRGKVNFQLTATIRNLSASAVVPTLHCVVVYEGVLSIINGSVNTNLGVLNEADILNSKGMDAIVYSPSGSVYGGNFMAGLKKFMVNAGKFVKKAARPTIEAARALTSSFAPQYAPFVEAADVLAKSQGLGLIGGRKLSAAQLTKRLEKAQQ